MNPEICSDYRMQTENELGIWPEAVIRYGEDQSQLMGRYRRLVAQIQPSLESTTSCSTKCVVIILKTFMAKEVTASSNATTLSRSTKCNLMKRQSSLT
jgi:hypothetical protein